MNPFAAFAGQKPGGPALTNIRYSRDTIRPFERLIILLGSLLLAGGLIAVLSGLFAGRDQPGVSGSQAVLGRAFPDLGHAHLRPGDHRPVYDSNPPTSGAHVPEPVLRQSARLSDDQLLEALELGDVVIMYGSPSPPPGLPQLARSIAGPFSGALAAAGQAVILEPRSGTRGIVALAWSRMLRVRAPGDPRLREFAQFWLGKGSGG